MKILAIDPGASGGIAWIGSNGLPGSCAMPSTDRDVVDLIAQLHRDGIETAVIEDVGGFTGKGQPGSAMFNFGDGCGFIRGVCMTLGMRIEMVRPQKWQKPLGLGTVKSAGSKKNWKNKLKERAQRLFPTIKVTLKTADALLIMEFRNSQKAE